MTRLLLAAVLACTACSADDEWECLLDGDPDFARQIGCDADFDVLSSDPPSASIPGAKAAKVVIDRIQDDALYIQNSKKYPFHHAFTSAHLSGGDLPLVPPITQFNQTEYSSPNRRFLLGSLTYYQGPQVWAYEIAPYDSATADMIEVSYDQLRENTFIGDELFFHPTSEPVELESANLPSDVRIITTGELFEGIDYQPLNLGTSMGRLTFITAAEVETGYVSFRDITVLDAVPNDISVTAGIITEAFQTPLSHINVLSQNRGTPNMGLRNAYQNEQLRALDGKWVELTVGPFEYSIREVTQDEADQWWEDNRPDPLGIPDLDLTVTELTDIETVLDLETYDLAGALDKAVPAFGGKASHYGALPLMGPDVPAPKAFGIPVYYYRRFMETNGFDAQVAALIADPQFQGDPAVRDAKLAELRDAMMAAPVDPTFLQAVIDKVNNDYPPQRMRFRSSTNAEDLDGFTGAGLYTSRSGDPNDPAYPVADAIRTVWASVWFFRAYEEREYRGIDHTAVGMALLVHRSFPDEEANGVALTANIFDRLCAEPGFYVNVQAFEESVVFPEPGVTTDQFIYHFDYSGQPIVWLSHSSLVPDGASVLTRAQTFELGKGLKAVHQYFAPAYQSPAGCEKFYAMDVEFKFDGEPGEVPTLFIKQARPHPGWGL